MGLMSLATASAPTLACMLGPTATRAGLLQLVFRRERGKERETESEPLYSSPSIHLIIHGCVFFLHELRWTPQEQPEPLFSTRRKAFNDGKLGLSGKIHSTVELHEMNLLNQPIN